MTLSPGMNLLLGGNGSGKSSILEALSILSTGRSFRTPRIQDVIFHNADTLRVTGKLLDTELDNLYPLGISKTLRESRIRINHTDVHQQAELSRHLPLTLIHPGSLELLVGAPAQRRKLLDWVAFYRSADFHACWKNYQRVLKQRNACLRDPGQYYALDYWTEQLIERQPEIKHFREDALQALTQSLQNLDDLFMPLGAPPKLKLEHGFPADIDCVDKVELAQFFQQRKAQELKQGTTLYGTHRGDLKVLLNNTPVARVASRGQLKLLSIALLLAQSQAITHNITKRGIIAIDDLASELDRENQYLLQQALQKTRQQLIVTGTRKPDWEYLPAESQLFHVKHGQVQAENL